MAFPTIVDSTANGYQTISASVTVTKPVGLAVGDVMVLWVDTTHSSGSYSLSTPSGWTLQDSYTVQSARKKAIFVKTADSSDVASSDFTLTVADSAIDRIGGILVAINGAVTGTSYYVSDISQTSTVSATPLHAESLGIMFTAGADSSGTATTSSYTSTPTYTWSELEDQTSDYGAVDPVMSAASAQINSLTEITSVNATYSVAKVTNYRAIFIVRAPLDASGSNSLHIVSPTAFSQAGIADTNGNSDFLSTPAPTFNSQSGTSTAPTQWTEQTKESTTWTDKNI